nr:hypothetical protein [Fodinibius sp.]NIY30570.1 hypothetical protein [Fodinibius sp.]
MEEREQIEIIKKYQGFVRNNGSDTLMLVRYGAYGDHLFMSGVFPFLFEKYDRVLLEVNPKGIELFQHDNRFDFIGLYEPWNIPEKKRLRVVSEHWQTLLDRFPDYDFLNFWGSMEGSGIVHEDSPEALLSPSARKERFHINFHERHFQMAEMEVPDGWMATPEVFYPNEWEEWAQSWKKKDKDYFHMLIPIAGSTVQKVFPTWLPSFCRHLIDKYKDLKIYLFGDHECDGEDWDYERTISWTHRRGRERMSFAQVLLMAKYADYVLGPETGLLAGAGMWGTPKT